MWSETSAPCTSIVKETKNLACFLAEASYLKRIAVIPRTFCKLKKSEREPISGYFDVDVMNATVGIKYSSELGDMPMRGIDLVDSNEESPLTLLDSTAQLVIRDDWITPWDSLCQKHKLLLPLQREVEKLAFKPPKFIRKMIIQMGKAMENDFDYMNVRRGDKIKDKRRWPNLDLDTQVEIFSFFVLTFSQAQSSKIPLS